MPVKRRLGGAVQPPLKRFQNLFPGFGLREGLAFAALHLCLHLAPVGKRLLLAPAVRATVPNAGRVLRGAEMRRQLREPILDILDEHLPRRLRREHLAMRVYRPVDTVDIPDGVARDLVAAEGASAVAHSAILAPALDGCDGQ
jgi:hypothetical protein